MLLAQVDQLGLAHYRKIKMDFYDQMFFSSVFQHLHKTFIIFYAI